MPGDYSFGLSGEQEGTRSLTSAQLPAPAPRQAAVLRAQELA